MERESVQGRGVLVRLFHAVRTTYSVVQLMLHLLSRNNLNLMNGTSSANVSVGTNYW